MLDMEMLMISIVAEVEEEMEMECQGGKEEWTYESRIRIYRLISSFDMQSRDLSSVDYQVDTLLV